MPSESLSKIAVLNMFAAATCGKLLLTGNLLLTALKTMSPWQRAKDLFAIERLHMVVGGSHLCGVDPENYGVWFDRLAEFPVEKWRLNHCTGFKAAAAMAARFDDVDWAGVGCRYVL